MIGRRGGEGVEPPADELTAALDPRFLVRVARSRHCRAMQGRGLIVSDDRAPQGVDLALEFVRFCYRRRPVEWPHLYDEMCSVAGHGLFRGMGYLDLAEHGISFSLPEMPQLSELTRRVVAEESTPAVEPLPALPALNLSPATS
ncbi:MAG: hypothetical protein ACRD3J_21850 [Thermoanaerobaculia bacterium]